MEDYLYLKKIDWLRRPDSHFITILFDLLEISLKLYNTKSTRLLHIKKLIYFNVVYSILLKYKLGSVVA